MTLDKERREVVKGHATFEIVSNLMSRRVGFPSTVSSIAIASVVARELKTAK